MGRKRTERPKRKINPLYVVFCEGETEESYAQYLRSRFRIPIEIKTKITGQSITDRFIANHLREIRKGVSSELDKCYLMYDFDSPEFSTRLREITEGIVLGSNPCFELWYLLHYFNQKANISSGKCKQELIKYNSCYEKGKLNQQLRIRLDENLATAILRAKELDESGNPSSTVYKFAEEIIKCDKDRNLSTKQSPS